MEQFYRDLTLEALSMITMLALMIFAFDSPNAPASLETAWPDQRAHTARHTDTVFTMPAFGTREEWEAVAEPLRRQILLSSGLWPLPERTPLNAQVFDKSEHDGFSVEKVHFEAWPGFLVTGNLYRPLGKTGPFPAIVNPHGHWERGRLESSERGSVPARCITFARMGIIAFSYDMIGYNDSQQFKHNWISKEDKLWGIHPFAMQLWSSIRAVDFVESLPDVDPQRLGCTGASGGGTQTFSLVAVDPRIRAAAPVNMISSTMQGGCICENAPILRLHNSNMEIGALMAPRPMIMVSATGDWTRETPHVEYPAIRSIYRLYGAEDRLSNVPVDAPHNYNQSSREAVYLFFGKYFLPGQDWSSFTEPAFTVPSDEELRVLPDGVPEGLPDSTAIIAGIKERRGALWDRLLPRNRQEAAAFRAQYGSALSAVLGAAKVTAGALAPERLDMEERGEYVFERWVIRHPASGAAIPAFYFRAAAATPQGAVLLLQDEGKAAFANPEDGAPGPLVEKLLAAGKAVLAIDPFLLGETEQERFKVGTFMDTFQPTDFGYQVQDVLTALAFLRSRRDLNGDVAVVGLGGTGVTALLASAIDGEAGTTVADLNGFDFNSDEQWVERYYTPCIRSIGGLPAAAVQIATRDLYVANSPAPLPFANALQALDTDALAAVLAGH